MHIKPIIGWDYGYFNFYNSRFYVTGIDSDFIRPRAVISAI